MVTFELGRVDEVMSSCREMFEEHASSAGINNLSVNEEVYASLERAGVLDLFVAMDGDDIIGYMPVVRSPHHRQGNLALSVDCIFLMKKYRGSNIAYRFIKFAVNHYQNLSNAILSFPIQETHRRLLERLGFEEEAIMFRKFIK